MAKSIVNKAGYCRILKLAGFVFLVGSVLGCSNIWGSFSERRPKTRPNILLAISDDHSWPHASAYGCGFVKTPAFDRIAEQGILFSHAFCPSASCSPSRASLLTGRNIWQNAEAGVHGSLFPKRLKVYTELLEEAGYHVGFTGKSWGPGSWPAGGRTRNPVGKSYGRKKCKPPARGMHSCDYAANFAEFLKDRKPDQPFCFWYGAIEPHRPYQTGIGRDTGKKLESVKVPAFLPDAEVVRSELLDYAFEIEWFDKHLGRMIEILEEMGELDNTLIVVTADNGMPFPGAKMQNYEYSTHVPMAVRWGDFVKGGRVVDDFVSFIDLAPTFLDVAGLRIDDEMTGRSLMKVFASDKSGRVDKDRGYVLTGKERHSLARPANMCYPIRAVRTDRFLYIRNFKPDRWPSGDGPYYLDMHWWPGYKVPTASYILANKDDPEVKRFFEFNTARRPAEELYEVENDPGCLKNLADDSKYARIKEDLWSRLEKDLAEQGDPRVVGGGDFFDGVPCFGNWHINPKTKKPYFDDMPPKATYNSRFVKDAEQRNAKLRETLNGLRRK